MKMEISKLTIDPQLNPRVDGLDLDIVAEYTRETKAGKRQMVSDPMLGEYPNWSISPRALFVDISLVHNETQVRYLKRYCLAKGYMAFIDYSTERACWCWHTLHHLDGNLVWRKPIVDEFKKPYVCMTEGDIEKEIAQSLRNQGHRVRRQVRCGTGVADIVTEEAVYEVERTLTHGSLFEGIGQALIYRQSINPELKAIVIGRKSSENIKPIIKNAKIIGVEVQIWDN